MSALDELLAAAGIESDRALERLDGPARHTIRRIRRGLPVRRPTIERLARALGLSVDLVRSALAMKPRPQ